MLTMQAGADPAAVDQVGARPLEAAAEAAAREVVETLLPLTPPPPGWAGEWSTVTVMDAAHGAPRGSPLPSAAAEGAPVGCGGSHP